MMKSVFKPFKTLRTVIAVQLLLVLLCACTGNKSTAVSVWDNDSLWYRSEAPYDTSKIDVIYYVSTEVLSAKDSLGNVAWQSQLVPTDLAAMQGEIAWVEQNEFYSDFNVIAPYYHQFTFDAIWQLDRQAFDAVYQKVAVEACEAFDYYMEHQNHGRPFILAGFSQGAMLMLDILKHMTDEQYSRMIACYMQGYRLTADDLKHPHVKAATGETDRGVAISFNSVQKADAMWPLLAEWAAATINPVNWKTDDTPAEFSFDGTTNTVHIDKETNLLIVETDNPDYYHQYYEQATFYGDAGVKPDNLHHWDLLFYSRMIHDNALNRSNR